MVDRPESNNVIGSRVTLRNKFRSDGTLERRKARLVAQGFSQRPGINFFDTFSPVAHFSSIRLMTSLAARYNMKIRQFDVTTAYLNGELEEEVFMETPKNLPLILERIVDDEQDSFVGIKAKDMLSEIQKGDKVCKLRKSLYGLKQAGRSWYKRLNKVLKECGTTQPTRTRVCTVLVQERT